jgi:hypothetical protein
VTHAFKIGDKVRLKGGADVGFVWGTDRFTTGEPCYFVEPYLPGSGRMYVGETALEIATDTEPAASKPDEPKRAKARSGRSEATGSSEQEQAASSEEQTASAQ